MARLEKTVFISYRRADVYTALAVYENLKNQGYDVFFDYRSISSGDFEQIITSNIRARAHFLLILTSTALDRCNEPGDWLRREIEIAIDEKRNIVPLFFKGFSFGLPSASEKLTGKLKNLSRYNGLNVHEDYFDEAMDRLRTQYLNIPLDTVLHPVSTQVQKVVRAEQVAADKALEQIEDVKKLVRQGEEKPGVALVPESPLSRKEAELVVGQLPEQKKVVPKSSGRLVGGVAVLMLGIVVILGGTLIIWIAEAILNNPSNNGPAATASQQALQQSIQSGLTQTALGQALISTSNSFPPTLIATETFSPATHTSTVTEAPPSPWPGGNTPPAGKIVFTCYINQIDQICVMNADGTERRQLTSFPATAYYPSLSRDGRIIYFASYESNGFEIYSIDINGQNLTRLTNDIGSLYAPELSPDGSQIVFTKNKDGIWLMKPDGKNPHAITHEDDVDPTWSPDGSRIAFASSRTGKRQLYVMAADGSNIQQVTNLDGVGGRTTWSPDGMKIAFYEGPEDDRDIYIINADGTELTQLTNGGDNLGPSWSPDGNWIAFASYRDGNLEIYIMHPDGTGVKRLTNNSISDWQPRWGQ